MDTITNFLGSILGYVMAFCYGIFPNYGVAIILFTVLTKIILLPVSIPVHLNSIKMVRMQPALNFIKAENVGNPDTISEEQLKLYKKYHYHPMLGLIPLFLQIMLLMGVINVIYNPLTHVLRIPGADLEPLVSGFLNMSGLTGEENALQLLLVDALSEEANYSTLGSLIAGDVLARIQNLNMTFLGIPLGKVPASSGGVLILVPFLAAFAAWLLCFVQNRVNVLQSEQGKLNKLSTMVLSVGLSLYLGFFVPAGVGIYWFWGNIFAIIQLFALNFFINPRKYIDYDELEASRRALRKVAGRANAGQKLFEKDPFRNKEKEDYRRFYKTRNKQLVFYSEKNGFYKYYEGMIDYIFANSDLVIDYVTNDPKDAIFDKTSERFRTYYIGPRRIIPFMMKMDANVVVMTTPDLEKYHIKRSLVRKDTKYIYVPHSVNSANLTLRTGALDYFDITLLAGPRARAEVQAIEELHHSPKKHIVEWGSGLLDRMIEEYNQNPTRSSDVKTILIAPSWQDDNILDSCIDELLDSLLKLDCRVILRPHPQYLRYSEDTVYEIAEKYKEYSNFELQTDFSSNRTVYEADLVITDWSSIAFEYSFCTLNPSLFINTKLKVINPEWQEIDIVPLDLEIRDLVGKSIDKEDVKNAGEVAMELMNAAEQYRQINLEVREREVSNIGHTAEVGGQIIMDTVAYVEENKEEYLKYM